jgi:hypothetical protein
MTDGRQSGPEHDTELNAEREPQVEVELVKDLDVPRDDDDGLRGGVHCTHTTAS